MTSKIRQNFSDECEALINKQINMELYASYVYLEMVIMFKISFSGNYHFFSFTWTFNQKWINFPEFQITFACVNLLFAWLDFKFINIIFKMNT